MNRVEITWPFAGIASMQVCAVADATDEEILDVCNSLNASGTSNGWTQVIRKEGDEWQTQCACGDYPDRIHFMVNC